MVLMDHPQQEWIKSLPCIAKFLFASQILLDFRFSDSAMKSGFCKQNKGDYDSVKGILQRVLKDQLPSKKDL